jgi:hypothetical protein
LIEGRLLHRLFQHCVVVARTTHVVLEPLAFVVHLAQLLVRVEESIAYETRPTDD